MITLSRTGRAYRLLRLARNEMHRTLRGFRDVDSTCYLHASSRISRDLIAGPYAFVGRNCTIPPLVSIGRYSMLAADVSIVGDDHVWSEPGVPIQFSGRPPQKRTTIGSDVWIGHGAILLRGITIGEGAIVGAGSVVTGDVGPYELWVGTPARRLRDRFSSVEDRRRHAEMIAGPVLEPSFADPLEALETDR